MQMLERECEAVAAYVGELLERSPLQAELPVPADQIALAVTYLTASLKAMVTLSRKKVLEEVQAGRRALPFSLDGSISQGLLAQAASYAGIEAARERLTFAREWVPKMFSGYVLVREGERLRVLYPDLQQVLEATGKALAQARQAPNGLFIEAWSPDSCGHATIQQSYPAYYVYEVQARLDPASAWQFVDRAGRDQLVALLADAYHKGYWFVRQPSIAWTAN